jgi:hypothetical protein
LLNAVLDDVTPLAAGREGTVPRREGFAFLSSADSTTPVHIDLENNFLLQIYGAKEMNVGRFENEETKAREWSATTREPITDRWVACRCCQVPPAREA